MSTELKFHPNMSLDSIYEYHLNKICFSEKFKNYFVSKNGILKGGLTVSCNRLSRNPDKFEFRVERKIYGYDKTYNNGISPYSDLGDYEPGSHTTEESKIVEEYFKEFEPETWELMKNNFKY